MSDTAVPSMVMHRVVNTANCTVRYGSEAVSVGPTWKHAGFELNSVEFHREFGVIVYYVPIRPLHYYP